MCCFFILFLGMWNYNNQIRVRWISFFLAVFILGAIFAATNTLNPDGIKQPEIKTLITQASVYSEFLPMYFWPLIFMGFVLLLLLGVPSILIFGPLYLISGFVVAISVTIFSQSFASMIAIYLSRKKSWSAKIPNYVLTSLVASSATAGEISFWGRLYLSYPLRTIDLVSAALLQENDRAHKVYPSILLGLTLRILLPSLWAASLLDLIQNFSPNPVADYSWFLICSSLLIAHTVLPKIPELLICKSSLRSALIQIENWNTPLSSKKSGETGKKPRNRMKLGMQP